MINAYLRPLCYKNTDSKHFYFISLMVHDIPSVKVLFPAKNSNCIQFPGLIIFKNNFFEKWVEGI